MSGIEPCIRSVADVMTRSPAVIRAFIRLRLHCIGCPMAPFHTLADAGELHGVDVAEITSAVEASVAADPSEEARN